MARRSLYPSDTSDEQWALFEPLLPEADRKASPPTSAGMIESQTVKGADTVGR